jgi:AraC-like DNA-binding protein
MKPIGTAARHVDYAQAPALECSELSCVHAWEGAVPPDAHSLLEVILAERSDKIIVYRGTGQRIQSGRIGIRSPVEAGHVTQRHRAVARVRTVALAADERGLAFEAARVVRPPGVPNVWTCVDAPTLFARASAVFTAVEACAREVVRMLTDARAVESAPSDEPSIARIRRVLHARTTEEITLDDLASAVSLSRAHVVRAFHRAVGLTPHEYLMHLRVARARTLLWKGQRPTDVAYACAFCDQSHLNRWFLKVVGMTPGEYAASTAAGQSRPIAQTSDGSPSRQSLVPPLGAEP